VKDWLWMAEKMKSPRMRIGSRWLIFINSGLNCYLLS
jgi:hypothetical protein